MTLVEELRNSRIDPRVFTEWQHEIMLRAADRIEELEAALDIAHEYRIHDELIIELKPRME